MKQIRGNKNIIFTSKEVQNIIENNSYFEEIKDISDWVDHKDVLAYDIKFDSSVLEKAVEKDLANNVYNVEDEEEYSSALFEQAEYFMDAAVDEIKEHIETEYGVSHMDSSYDLYRQGEEMEDIYFILTLSIGKLKHYELSQITHSLIHEDFMHRGEKVFFRDLK